MIRIGILGATGYTALELIKILLRHPDVEILALTSRQEGAPHVATVHPQLAGRLDLALEDLDPVTVASRVDCIFSCLPHGTAATALQPVLDTDVRVIDYSADFRLWDSQVYADWYGVKHPSPERLGKIPYGLPEFFREQVSQARHVANPGCYPTSVLLAVVPLLREGLIEPEDLIFDSKSGVSGAGRGPKLTTHYPECNESVSAYHVGRHHHVPEITQILRHVAGTDVQVIFTPHLIPMDRGILTTAYARPRRPTSEREVLDTLKSHYRHEPFVRVVDHLPATKDTAGSNFCDLTARIVQQRIIVISCLDNLLKGASGTAVQNMNLMFGCPETTGF